MRKEPQDYASYSTTRPDIAALGCGPRGQMMLGDTKVWDPVGGDGLADVRGAYVAMGNTRPAARAQARSSTGCAGAATRERSGLGLGGGHRLRARDRRPVHRSLTIPASG